MKLSVHKLQLVQQTFAHDMCASILFCNKCCHVHAVKTEARKTEQEIYSLVSEQQLLHEQVELERSGVKSGPTPVSPAPAAKQERRDKLPLITCQRDVAVAQVKPALSKSCKTLQDATFTAAVSVGVDFP